MLMDTLGLNIFGLPDLQCHFRDLKPSELAPVLYRYGSYIFEKGDVIGDGHTIQGISVDQKWKCQHEKSLVAPERIIIDINPGEQYAAGRRK